MFSVREISLVPGHPFCVIARGADITLAVDLKQVLRMQSWHREYLANACLRQVSPPVRKKARDAIATLIDLEQRRVVLRPASAVPVPSSRMPSMTGEKP